MEKKMINLKKDMYMNIYHAFYCRAYDWYNTTGKKNKDTLRVSAIILISALQFCLFFTGLVLISILERHTPLNKWVMVFIILGFMIINLRMISTEKSDTLRVEYEQLPDSAKKRINFLSYLVLAIIILCLITVIICDAYYKKQYGNYDL
jgi:magnesium-transporting ATPase (P-type)